MNYTCASCETRLSLLAGDIVTSGVCPSCQAPRPPLDEPLEVDEALFEEVVRGVEAPILVDFWAPWCGPCQIAAPEVHQTAIDMAGSAVVLKVNTDENPQLSRRFGVRGIPHFLIIKGGEVVFEEGGLFSAEEMNGWLRAALREV